MVDDRDILLPLESPRWGIHLSFMHNTRSWDKVAGISGLPHCFILTSHRGKQVIVHSFLALSFCESDLPSSLRTSLLQISILSRAQSRVQRSTLEAARSSERFHWCGREPSRAAYSYKAPQTWYKYPARVEALGQHSRHYCTSNNS